MKFRVSIFILALLLMQLGMGLSTDLYIADKAHTDISFTVTHMIINKVRGEFRDFNVKFNWDPQNLSASSVEAVINVNSINTDNPKRDNHLRSADFLNARKFPQIIFKSTKIEKKGDAYIAHGELTIRGVTRAVDLPFTVAGPITDPMGNTRIGISASTRINRMDFGVSWNRTLDNGGLVVGNEVQISIDAEFIKQPDGAASQ